MKKATLTFAAFLLFTVTFGQQYKIEHSEITFESTAPKEDISAKNEKSIGIIDFSENKFSIRVPILKFIFPNELMQEHFNENYMESDLFPNASYSGLIEGDYDLKKDGEYLVMTKGKINIHGIEMNVGIPSKIIVAKKDISIMANFTLKPADFNIKIPSDMKDNIAEEMRVKINGSLVKK